MYPAYTYRRMELGVNEVMVLECTHRLEVVLPSLTINELKIGHLARRLAQCDGTNFARVAVCAKGLAA
jgi:hypothetical protein